jgi:hypothetical protein
VRSRTPVEVTVQRSFNLQTYIEVGHLVLALVGGIRTYRHPAALFEDSHAAGGYDDGKVLQADRLAAVALLHGVGEAIDFPGLIKVGEDLLRECDVLGRGSDGNGALRWHIHQPCLVGQIIAKVFLKIFGVIRLREVGEVKGLIDFRASLRVGILRLCNRAHRTAGHCQCHGNSYCNPRPICCFLVTQFGSSSVWHRFQKIAETVPWLWQTAPPARRD